MIGLVEIGVGHNEVNVSRFLLASPVLLGFCCDARFFFLIWVFVLVRFWWVVGSGGVAGMVEAQ